MGRPLDPHDAELWQRFCQMLQTGYPTHSVGQCMEAVRYDRRIERGFYDISRTAIPLHVVEWRAISRERKKARDPRRIR